MESAPARPPENTRELSTRIRGSAAGGGGTAPDSSWRALIPLLYNFALASLRSTNTLPSKLTPANNPLVFEYENTAATPLVLAAPAASAFRPTGPAANETFPPSVMLPACEKVRTAAASLRIKTKSVNSNPICPPNPAPAVAIADGADQDPSASRATTTPEPKRPDPKKPALRTERIARPCV